MALNMERRIAVLEAEMDKARAGIEVLFILPRLTSVEVEAIWGQAARIEATGKDVVVVNFVRSLNTEEACDV